MTEYRGRFAPSPTGPLHFGSLFAAVVSYLDAKANQGVWLLRIENIDPPREQAGATSAILKTLEAHGLQWDEPVVYQSQQTPHYKQTLEQLEQLSRLFWCDCSRTQLSGQLVYPGYCQAKTTKIQDHAIRFRVLTEQDSFDDIFQGSQSANILTQHGDVILRRRDGLFAYQLAVVCDDIAQKITHVIRGIDLITSTFWQRELFRALNKTTPNFGHFPVILASQSRQKLSKQNLATPVNNADASKTLRDIFTLLNMQIEPARPLTMLQQASVEWQRASLRKMSQLEQP